jgi:hypothetical protein
MKKNGYLNYYAKERARTHTIDGTAQLYDRTAVATIWGKQPCNTKSSQHVTSKYSLSASGKTNRAIVRRTHSFLQIPEFLVSWLLLTMEPDDLSIAIFYE